MNPNQQQVADWLRTGLGTLGGIIMGWFAARGWTLTPDEQKSVLSLLQSPELVGLIMSGITAVMGYMAHTHQAAVATVAQIAADPKSPVVGVVTTNDAAGRQLAESIAHLTVAAANSQAAVSIAQDSVP